MAAREPKELWLLPGMGHAEAACSQDLVDRIGRWIDQATSPARAITVQPDITVQPGITVHPGIIVQPGEPAALDADPGDTDAPSPGAPAQTPNAAA
jgi:hypothetical protein